MAKRKQADHLQVAAISASVALLIVLTFYGGAITGNSVVTYTLTANIDQSLDCTLNSGASGAAFTDVTAGSTATPVDVTLTNDGAGEVDVDLTSDKSGQALLGGGTTSKVIVGIKTNDGSNTVNEANSTTGAFSTTDLVTDLPSIDSGDDVVFNITVSPAGDADKVTTQTMVITFTCTTS